jgi:hypothetical protein
MKNAGQRHVLELDKKRKKEKRRVCDRERTCQTPTTALAMRITRMTNGSTKAVTRSRSSSSKKASTCIVQHMVEIGLAVSKRGRRPEQSAFEN